jgi:hypothetical protein
VALATPDVVASLVQVVADVVQVHHLQLTLPETLTVILVAILAAITAVMTAAVMQATLILVIEVVEAVMVVCPLAAVLAMGLVVAAVVDDGVLSVEMEASTVRIVLVPSTGAMEADGLSAMVDTLAAIVVLWVLGAVTTVVTSRRLLMKSSDDRRAFLKLI